MRRQHTGGLQFRGWAMTIMAGSMAAGRHGAGAVAESSHPDPLAGDREWYIGNGLLKPQCPLPGAPPPTRPQLLIHPQTAPPTGEQGCKHMSPWGLLSFKPPHNLSPDFSYPQILTHNCLYLDSTCSMFYALWTYMCTLYSFICSLPFFLSFLLYLNIQIMPFLFIFMEKSLYIPFQKKYYKFWDLQSLEIFNFYWF